METEIALNFKLNEHSLTDDDDNPSKDENIDDSSSMIEPDWNFVPHTSEVAQDSYKHVLVRTLSNTSISAILHSIIKSLDKLKLNSFEANIFNHKNSNSPALDTSQKIETIKNHMRLLKQTKYNYMFNDLCIKHLYETTSKLSDLLKKSRTILEFDLKKYLCNKENIKDTIERFSDPGREQLVVNDIQIADYKRQASLTLLDEISAILTDQPESSVLLLNIINEAIKTEGSYISEINRDNLPENMLRSLNLSVSIIELVCDQALLNDLLENNESKLPVNQIQFLDSIKKIINDNKDNKYILSIKSNIHASTICNPVTPQSMRDCADILYSYQNLVDMLSCEKEKSTIVELETAIASQKQLLENFRREQQILFIAYDQWYDENITQLTQAGLGLILKSYADFLEAVDTTFMYCASKIHNDGIINATKEIVQSKDKLSEFQSALVEKVLIPLMKVLESKNSQVKPTTIYALWLINNYIQPNICQNTTNNQINDLMLRSTIQQLLSLPLPTEKKFSKRSVFQALLKKFISTYSTEGLLCHSANLNRRLMTLNNILLNVLAPNNSAKNISSGISDDADNQTKLLYYKQASEQYKQLYKESCKERAENNSDGLLNENQTLKNKNIELQKKIDVLRYQFRQDNNSNQYSGVNPEYKTDENNSRKPISFKNM